MPKEKIICHNVFGDEKEAEVSELIFRPSVYGILIEDGKILLSRQWDGYDFPGGGMKIDETMDEVLEREFWEETGLKVKRGRPVVCETSFFITRPPKEDKKYNCQLLYFLCEKISGELSKEFLDDDEQDYADLAEWVDLGDVDKIKFYNSIDSVKIIREAEKLLKLGLK